MSSMNSDSVRTDREQDFSDLISLHWWRKIWETTVSKNSSIRKATQLWTCRAVLSKYLTGEQLELALRDMKDAMRHGPQAWAFKPKDEVPEDDRVYYETGGYEV